MYMHLNTVGDSEGKEDVLHLFLILECSKNAKKNRPYQWTVQQPVPQLYSFVFFNTMQ